MIPGSVPHCARSVELRYQLLEPTGARGTVPFGLLHRILGEVEGHHLVVRVAVNAMDHVAAHLSEAYESKLH